MNGTRGVRRSPRDTTSFSSGEEIITPEIPVAEPCLLQLRDPRARRAADALRAFLTERGIGTQIHYPVPIHMQEAAQFLGYRKGDLPVTEKVSGEVLSLPMYAELTDSQIDRVATNVTEFMRTKA